MANERAIVITGASTGIGRACVERAAKEGAHVFAGVRKQADADSLKQEFGDSVTPLILDVTNDAQIQAAVAQVSAWLNGRTLFGLVNNAGIAVAGPLPLQPLTDVRKQFETNFFGLHAATQAFLPLLGADRTRTGAPGRVVMMSSVGGKNGSPFVGAYAASKHAVEGYSQSLRRELMLYGIKVVVVAPGAVATPIWDKADEDPDLARYRESDYGAATDTVRKYMIGLGRQGLPPSAIGDVVWTGLAHPNPRQRYTVLRGKFMNYTLPRILPQPMVDNIIANRLGLRQPRR
ncbi:MAG: SDR family NAD(P)-dependent oxidoreductase [Hyphomonadaceae bacterium]